MRKGERKVVCPKGHPYAGDNLYVLPNGASVCRQCMRDREVVRKADPEAKAENVRRYHKWRLDNIANRRCVYCSQPAAEGITRCAMHAAQRREKRSKESKARREANAKALQKRIDAGWCPDCIKDVPARECVQHWTDFKEARWARRREELRKTGKYKETKNEWRRRKKKEDPGYWVESNLRRRVLKAVQAQGTTKSRTTAKLVGCSTKALIGHLEAQFLPGMTWDDRSSWHVDHRRPCASYDLTDPEQQRLCFHYTNLQPLWAPENFKKGDKWDATSLR